MRRVLRLATSAMVLGALAGASPVLGQSEFPHEKHSVFFSDCSACHGGVTSGIWSEVYPDVSMCATCHDGGTAPAVHWAPSEAPRASNLAFKHEPHGFACATCHLPGGEEDLASLAIPQPGVCLGCHAPEAEGHLNAVEACQTCHVPAWKTGVTPDGMAGLPKPDSHAYGDFLRNHRGAAASSPDYCGICHTESSCASCHEGQEAPSFHPLNFMAFHGPEAYGRTSDCSTCHNAEAFCRACHSGLGVNASGAAGVAYHDNESFWILSHAPAARQDLESCVSCHQQTDCLRCHSAQAGLGVSPHGPDFQGSSISERNKAMCRLCHISGN
jgi:hypothetical protein